MAGNATVGLEIVEDLPDVDAVLVPYGGGGFAVSVASAVKALRPEARVYAAEVEAGPAFAASLAAGRPTEIDHPTSFVSGIGSPVVFEDVWPLAREILDGSVVSTLEETANAVGLVAQRPGSWRRERERLQWRGPYRAGRVMGRSPASCRAATSTPRSSPKSCAAASPDTRACSH